MKKLIAALALLLAPASAFAHHGGVTLAFGPGSPVETNSPLTLPDGGFVAGLRVEEVGWRQYSHNSDGTPKKDNATYSTFMNASLSYGFTPALMGTLIVPYYIKDQETYGSNEGLADVKLQFTYGFHYDPATGFSRNTSSDSAVSMEAQKERTWLSVTVGGSFPNGDHTKSRPLEQGTPDRGYQTGFGAPSFTLGAAAAHTFGQVTLNADVGFDIFMDRSDTAGNYQYGSEARVDLAGVYELYGNTNSFLSKVDGILELNFLHLDHDSVDGVKDMGSGGDVLYLSPGLRFSFPSLQNANLGILCKFPVATSLNDTKVNAQGSEGVENFRLISTLSLYF